MRAEWVPYGRPAAEALRAAIATAKGAEPLAPVTVVVPSNHVGVATRRLLASGTLGSVCGRGVGIAAVDFLTTFRLAELLGAPALAGSGRRPVSTPVIAAAVRATLASDPGPFAPVAEHPATEAALVAAYRELRDTSTEGLDHLARSSRRAAEVVRLHRCTRERLEPAWYDEQDLMVAATSALREQGGPASLGQVVVYLPQLLSRHAADLLVAAGERTQVSVVAGTTGDDRADAEVALSLARLAVTPAPAGDVPLADVVSTDRTSILTTSDSDDELRATVRAVVDAARDGIPLDRMAILHAGPGPYGRLAHEHLAAAGLASNGPSVLPLASRAAGRFLLGLLTLPEGDFRRAEVVGWLSDAPLVLHGRRIPIAQWDAASREAGVVGGRDDWDRRLTRRAEDLDERADAPESAEPTDAAAAPGPVATGVGGQRIDVESLPMVRSGAGSEVKDQLRDRAARVRELRQYVLDVIDSLTLAAGAPRPWEEHAAWARDLLDRLLARPSNHAPWPAAEQRATERVEAALDRLAALGSIEGPVTLDVFHRTLELELESDLGRVGRFGEGVLVGPVSMGIGLDLDLVLVVGLAEGTFPAQVHDDSLLPDDDRLATGDELPLRRTRVDTQHRQFLASIAAADRHLLTFPRGDLRRSVERVPSRWLLDVASELAGQRWWSPDLTAAANPWLAHVGSFDAGLRTLAFPATRQEHRLRSLLAAAEPRTRIEDPEDPVLAAGATLVAARQSPAFTRFDGNLAGVPLDSPVGTITSATALERWARCPQAYFQERILGIRELEHPEDSLRITPIDWGNLVHAALERFIVEVLEATDGAGPPPDQPWSPADRLHLLGIADELFTQFEEHGLTGRTIFWRRDRGDIVRDLLRFLAADSLHRNLTGARPLAAELRFGFARPAGPDRPDDSAQDMGAAELPPVTMPLMDGRSLSFRGSADRIDRGADGTLHVVDYKTGRATAYTGLSEDQPTHAGTRLQLPIYGQAARAKAGSPDAPVRAEYWFVSAKGEFKRLGYEITDAVLERVSADLTQVIAGIEAGTFPHHPTALSTSPFVECAYCDPDALGVSDLRRRWDAKRSDPVLAAYADVVEPLEPAEPDSEPEPEP